MFNDTVTILQKIQRLSEEDKAYLLNLLGITLTIDMILKPSMELSEEQRQHVKSVISKKLAVKLLEIFPSNAVFKEIVES